MCLLIRVISKTTIALSDSVYAYMCGCICGDVMSGSHTHTHMHADTKPVARHQKLRRYLYDARSLLETILDQAENHMKGLTPPRHDRTASAPSLPPLLLQHRPSLPALIIRDSKSRR